MTKVPHNYGRSSLTFSRVMACIAVVFSLMIISMPASAQQAGSVSGRVTQDNGEALAGVTIEATSSVLPRSRSTTSAANGRYRLPLLPPGSYTLTFKFEDGSEQTRSAAVVLQQSTQVNVAFGTAIEEVVVTASRSLANAGIGALNNTIGFETIDGVPVGQEYRDLIKLIPGVQYTEDSVRGPSAGGSGQDNNYQFDGVDVSLPMFGVLSAEPSSHDIAQMSVVRGGATAVGFNRSGGFLVNTISKSGTDEFHGEASVQMQTSGMTGGRKTGDSPVEFDEDKMWLTTSLGGPVIKDRLFFYTSFYRPTSSRANVSNAYGDVPDFDDKRNEFFGKLTFSPTDNILLDASYRTSDHSVRYRGVSAYEAASTSVGDDASQDIAIVEGSWVINDKSSMSFKYTNFTLNTSARPDTPFDFAISQGDSLNIGALNQAGYFNVPSPLAGEDAYNAFIQPYIDQYGYMDGGVATGGGAVGGYSQINDQNFRRNSFEISFDRQIYSGDVSHNIHLGYKREAMEEDLARLSNGWGSIEVLGGRVMATDGVTPIFFRAWVNQMSLGGDTSPLINSRSEMQNFEINDEIEMENLTINVGVLVSNDVLFGQGLKENKNNPVSGFEVSPGSRYKMYESNWKDMLQPRFSVNWDYSDTSSVYVNFARYHPSASSLARAASWARNLRRTIKVEFDANGDFIEIDPERASSGKMFQENMDPRKVDEFIVGWNSDVSSDLTLRAHARYRSATNFWEDTWNGDRTRGDAPADVPAELYIPNLQDYRDEIGGSSYVIAQLDTAYTKYWELSLEAEWSRDNFFVNASYVLSHYYGNYDQDNTNNGNDMATFIGSSNLADGAGRQPWNFKDGDLRGDRRHIFKVFGFYKFDWNGQAGAYVSYQSGQPWEIWDYSVYSDLTGSTSDTIRYAEPAGSRRGKSHLQVDLNYTQNVEVIAGHNIQVRIDLYNALNSQTGYNIESRIHSAGFGEPRDFYKPRRIQVAAKYRF